MSDVGQGRRRRAILGAGRYREALPGMREERMGNHESESVAFQCSICGQPSTEGLLHVGLYCSELCKRKLMERDEERKRELLAEPIEIAPDEFDLDAFERYIMKAALHMIHALPPKEKLKWKKNMPHLLAPDTLAMEIKERALAYLKNDYVSVLENKGNKFFVGGTYQLKKKIPRHEVFAALVRAKVFKQPPRAGDP